jgi:hypothetical protein
MKRHIRLYVPYPPRPGGIACLGYLHADPAVVLALLAGASLTRTDGGAGDLAWTDLVVTAPPPARNRAARDADDDTRGAQ